MERLVLVWLLLTGGVGGGKASFGVVATHWGSWGWKG